MPRKKKEEEAIVTEVNATNTTNTTNKVLMIDAGDTPLTYNTKEEQAWHEVQHAYISGKMLTGSFTGLETAEDGTEIAVIDYKQIRVIIPVTEMLDEDMSHIRLMKIVNGMLGSEVDFLVLGIDNNELTAIGNRNKAMSIKRRRFYFDDSSYRITEGRIIEARIIYVAQRRMFVEAFGATAELRAKDISWEWITDLRTTYHNGDRVIVKITDIRKDAETTAVGITCEMKSLTENMMLKRLEKCRPKGKYSGKVTDVYKGVVFIVLNTRVNAIAHSCTDDRMPGKGDDVIFVVTRIDTERQVAVGVITKIIKQNI